VIHSTLLYYLLNQPLLIKIYLVFVELLNFKLSSRTTETVVKTRFSEFVLILATLPQV